MPHLRDLPRYLGTIGYIVAGLLVLSAYAQGRPLGGIGTLAAGFACVVTAVWMWVG